MIGDVSFCVVGGSGGEHLQVEDGSGPVAAISDGAVREMIGEDQEVASVERDTLDLSAVFASRAPTLLMSPAPYAGCWPTNTRPPPEAPGGGRLNAMRAKRRFARYGSDSKWRCTAKRPRRP